MLNSSADLDNGTQLDSSPFHDGYGNIFHDFHDFYLPIHGYLSLTVCVFGTITNILNIIVLTRKEMESATNKILTGLAVADMLVMIDYIPFAIHNFIKTHESEVDKFSLPWTVYTLIHAHVSVVGHTISTWLTVILAVWRYLSVRFPTESRSWLIVSNALWSILVTYVLVPIFCIPIYLSFTISEEMLTEESNSTNSSSIFYRVDWSVIAQENNGLLRQINFWVFSVGTKLVPCVLLTYLSSALIRVLMQTEKRKKRLKENCYILAGSKSTNNGLDATNATSNTELSTVKVNDSSVSKQQRSAKEIPVPAFRKAATVSGTASQSDRTTRMLLGVLILFLLTESPTGILVLVAGIVGEPFFLNVYKPLGEILDLLALVNSAVNFVLYCSMSKQFRQTFAKLFFL